MEPNKGGWLASEVSKSGKLLKSANPEQSVASWAFRYLIELEGVMTILTGMGNTDVVEDNIKTFHNYRPLSKAEHDLIKKAVEIIRSTPSIPCTDCRYCMPHCPKEIPIPPLMQLLSTYMVHGSMESLQHLYTMGKRGARSQDCIKCGACETICPQHIKITEHLAELTNLAAAK